LSLEKCFCIEVADIFRTDSIEEIKTRVRYYITRYPELLAAVDSAGRTAMECASAVNKSELQMLPSTSILWHNRYSIISEVPIHVSDESIIFKAKDVQVQVRKNNGGNHSERKKSGEGFVSIKLMRSEIVPLF
jgi:hypothetical protein